MTKDFSLSNSMFRCLIEDNGYVGSLEFDFSDRSLSGHAPENMDTMDWLICCRKFIALCNKMNAPFLDT